MSNHPATSTPAQDTDQDPQPATVTLLQQPDSGQAWPVDVGITDEQGRVPVLASSVLRALVGPPARSPSTFELFTGRTLSGPDPMQATTVLDLLREAAPVEPARALRAA